MDTEIAEKKFKSVPWCFNGHIHTVLCSTLMSAPNLSSERIEIDTPDNDFDNQITAPLHGFADADDYYRRTAEHYKLNVKLYEEVTNVEVKDGSFIVTTDKSSYKAKKSSVGDRFLRL